MSPDKSTPGRAAPALLLSVLRPPSIDPESLADADEATGGRSELPALGAALVDSALADPGVAALQGSPTSPRDGLKRTPLHALHRELGARMVPFAGYDMPVSYPAGIMAEHRFCRTSATLFDVSHMGQLRLTGAHAAAALETLMPIDVTGLDIGQQRYGFFTNLSGGIIDDVTVTRRRRRDAAAGSSTDETDTELFLVVNAACKDEDLRHLMMHIGHRCMARMLDDHGLLALQGPKAAHALARINTDAARLPFMTGDWFRLAGVMCHVTRFGYTGEDGFEISVPGEAAERVARALLDDHTVLPAGLGARDTLRLEAGLCLQGQDIGPAITPIEAGLEWAIPPERRAGGSRAGHYPGSDAIDTQLVRGPIVRRVGLYGLERAPVREGAKLTDIRGRLLGHVTSGTIGPTVDRPIAMAYLAAGHSSLGSEVFADVRGERLPMRVTSLPFVPNLQTRG